MILFGLLFRIQPVGAALITPNYFVIIVFSWSLASGGHEHSILAKVSVLDTLRACVQHTNFCLIFILDTWGHACEIFCKQRLREKTKT